MSGASIFDYTVQGTKNPRGFRVVDITGKALAEMHQPSIWSQDMEGNAGGSGLRISSEGFWRSRYGLFINGVRCGSIATGTWGILNITIEPAERPPVKLFLRRAGFWSGAYDLGVAKDLPLLRLEPVFRWTRFRTDFEVRVVGSGISQEQMPLMLAVSAFCARLQQTRKSAAAG